MHPCFKFGGYINHNVSEMKDNEVTTVHVSGWKNVL